MSAILLNSRSIPALKGGHDAIDIIKVEKHTKSPNINIMLSGASFVYAKDRAGHVLLWVTGCLRLIYIYLFIIADISRYGSLRACWQVVSLLGLPSED